LRARHAARLALPAKTPCPVYQIFGGAAGANNLFFLKNGYFIVDFILFFA